MMEAFMDIRPMRVLFLSRRNTVRSLMAEAVMNQTGGGRFIGLSAGVLPAKGMDPLTVRTLEKARYDVEGLKPKTIEAFSEPDAAQLDFVFTLSDTARGETLPQWPGHPVSAHWQCDDPVLDDEDEIGKALGYGRVLAGLERRIQAFMQLPFQSLDRISLQGHVNAIGES
jgi:protein-tyrosine-phosphatase